MVAPPLPICNWRKRLGKAGTVRDKGWTTYPAGWKHWIDRCNSREGLGPPGLDGKKGWIPRPGTAGGGNWAPSFGGAGPPALEEGKVWSSRCRWTEGEGPQLQLNKRILSTATIGRRGVAEMKSLVPDPTPDPPYLLTLPRYCWREG